MNIYSFLKSDINIPVSKYKLQKNNPISKRSLLLNEPSTFQFFYDTLLESHIAFSTSRMNEPGLICLNKPVYYYPANTKYSTDPATVF